MKTLQESLLDGEQQITNIINNEIANSYLGKNVVCTHAEMYNGRESKRDIETLFPVIVKFADREKIHKECRIKFPETKNNFYDGQDGFEDLIQMILNYKFKDDKDYEDFKLAMTRTPSGAWRGGGFATNNFDYNIRKYVSQFFTDKDGLTDKHYVNSPEGSIRVHTKRSYNKKDGQFVVEITIHLAEKVYGEYHPRIGLYFDYPKSQRARKAIDAVTI